MYLKKKNTVPCTEFGFERFVSYQHKFANCSQMERQNGEQQICKCGQKLI